MAHDNSIFNRFKESKRIIRQAMETHQLVLFVGAGASIPSGMPSWPQAVRMIADRLSITNEPLDALRIPQYYYNARGKKEYTQLMREIFHHGDYIVKNEIHDKIIEFHTKTIVTTNYDHLIEQAAEEHSQILSVVSKDADLPYRKGDVELIKMHGDFENDNFVLKEDDYLAYSENFKLIENYVKSLIGTKVVLFMGYSFNDPDLKLIFSWVKDILGSDFQRAYMIEAGKAYDGNEEAYFGNFGINLLYASFLLQDQYRPDDLKHNLLCMLEELLTPNATDKLTTLRQELKPFQAMRYAGQKYVKRALNHAGIIADGSIIKIHDTLEKPEAETKSIFNALAYGQWVRCGRDIHLTPELLPWSGADTEAVERENNMRAAEYFQDYKPNRDEQGKIDDILDILVNSSLRIIEAHLPKDKSGGWRILRIPLSPTKVPPWMEAVDTFDSAALEKLAESNSLLLTETNPDLYMEQGYVYFLLGDYVSSYSCYKNAKSIYNKLHKYVQCFMAEFNRSILGRLISYGLGGNSPEALAAVEEWKSIDLDRLFHSLPGLGESNVVMKELYTFGMAHTLFRDTYKASEKVSEEAKTRYFLFAGRPAFASMRESVEDYYRYITWNLLPVNNFNEQISIFLIYFQSIINSVMTTEVGDIDLPGTHGSVHARELEPFDIMIALKFVGTKIIRRTLWDYSENLPLSDAAIDYLQRVINNCRWRKRRGFGDYFDVFWKCITFLGKIALSDGLVEAALEKLNGLIILTDYRIHAGEIVCLVNNAFRQERLSEKAVTLLLTFVRQELEQLSRDKDEANYQRNLILTVLWACKQRGTAFDETEYIRPLLSGRSRFLCTIIYDYVGERCQSLISEEYRNWKPEDGNDWFEFYYGLVDAGIIKPNTDAEKRILAYFHKPEPPLPDGLILSLPVRDDRQVLSMMLDLYTKALILDKASFWQLLKEKDVEGAEWLMDYINYDYRSFDINWLTNCSAKLLREICHDTAVRDKIKAIIEKEFRKGKAGQKIVDLYFMYFTV